MLRVEEGEMHAKPMMRRKGVVATVGWSPSLATARVTAVHNLHTASAQAGDNVGRKQRMEHLYEMESQQMATATILVVDDDVAIRDLLTEVFELEGYQVKSAANGASAPLAAGTSAALADPVGRADAGPGWLWCGPGTAPAGQSDPDPARQCSG
jgi:hypothetical protein